MDFAGGELMERTFKIIGLDLVGKKEIPQITMKNAEGERLTIRLQNKKQLDTYKMEQIFNVTIVKGQQTLA